MNESVFGSGALPNLSISDQMFIKTVENKAKDLLKKHKSKIKTFFDKVQTNPGIKPQQKFSGEIKFDNYLIEILLRDISDRPNEPHIKIDIWQDKTGADFSWIVDDIKLIDFYMKKIEDSITSILFKIFTDMAKKS